MKNENEFAKVTMAATLEITRLLPATPERVWDYLVDPELRKLWFCAGETGSQAGEPFVMAFDHSRISESAAPEGIGCGDPIEMEGTITQFEPPSTLAYEWPGEDGLATLVTIRLKPENEGTRLDLTHERLVSSEFRKGASAGWHAHLDLLVDLTNQRPARDFWLHYGKLKLEYDRRFESDSAVADPQSI